MGQLCPRDPGSAGALGRGPGTSHREQQPCLFASRTSPPKDRLICSVHFCLLKREWWRVKAHLSLSKHPEASQRVHLWLLLPRSHPGARCLPILSQCPLQCIILIQELLWSLEWLGSWSSNPGFWLHTFFSWASLQSCSWVFGPQMNGSCSPRYHETSPSQRVKKNHHFCWLRVTGMVPALSPLLITIIWCRIYDPYFKGGESLALSRWWRVCWGLRDGYDCGA